jgi:hypothetical protein
LPVLGGSGWARAPIGKKATTRPKKLKFWPWNYENWSYLFKFDWKWPLYYSNPGQNPVHARFECFGLVTMRYCLQKYGNGTFWLYNQTDTIWWTLTSRHWTGSLKKFSGATLVQIIDGKDLWMDQVV